MQVAPIHLRHVYWQIEILKTIFEKGHPRNFPTKLSQNLTSGFREEEFLRICSCLYSESYPHSLEPCLLTDQNFANKFWKGSPKEHSCEIISKSDQRFQRSRFSKNFIMSVQCKKPPFTRAMFMDGSKFCKQFLKRVTQTTFLWNYFKIGPVVSEDFFNEFLHVCIVQEAPFTRAMLMDGSKFCQQFSKRVTQGTFLWNYFKIRPVVPEEKIFKELLKKFNFVAIATRVFDGIKFCEQFLNF